MRLETAQRKSVRRPSENARWVCAAPRTLDNVDWATRDKIAKKKEWQKPKEHSFANLAAADKEQDRGPQHAHEPVLDAAQCRSDNPLCARETTLLQSCAIGRVSKMVKYTVLVRGWALRKKGKNKNYSWYSVQGPGRMAQTPHAGRTTDF